MVRIVADENFNNNILRGLILREPNVDVIRVQDIGLSGASDPAILEWAAQNSRVLVTHDAETVPYFAYERMKSGLNMAGVFIISQDRSIANAIDDLLLIIQCSDNEEWANCVIYLPL